MNRSLIALAVTVTLAAGASAFAATESYSDVSNSWAQSDINTMVNQKVMTGFNDGKFHPDAWVTRTEFTQMSAKTLGLPLSQADTVPSFKTMSSNNLGFSNVDNQTWLSAYPSGVFRPANPVRRVEALSALAGALNKPLVSDAEATQILSKYTDANQIPANARLQTATAIKYNLFEIDPKSGSNVIEPLRPVTRAEVAAMLSDLHQNRDIAIVQNGQLISAQAGTQPTTQSATTTTVDETTTSTTTTTTTGTGAAATGGAVGAAATSQTTEPTDTTTGTSMVRTSEAEGETTSAEQTGTTTTGEATGTTTTTPTQTADTSSHIDFMQGRGTPYRNSADTIPEFRSVNVTTTPTSMDAQTPVSLPANATFTGTVAKSLYTAYNRPGDPVMVILDHPLIDANGRVVAPAGSKILGIVTSVVSKNRSGDTPQIGLNFNGMITPDGQQIPINATVNNTDGVLKAGELQGIVFHPNHSTAALKREISASEGGLYGTKMGKAYVLEEPLAYQVSDKPVDPMDISANSDLVIGVGDRLQLRIENVGSTTQQQNTTTQ
ncbi:MAG: hypothetical protein K0Q50_439 [Vampirovibrio sp.]|jgi:hypothetical protein|nr:hypothetical protein [Vampirovibrio sp.]